MKNYQLQTWEKNPILRTKSTEVEKITPEIKQFAKNLIDLMYKRDGVGLAAPQVGKNLRMIAVTQWRGEKILKDTVMINPVIIEYSQHMKVQEEACLSLPNIIWDVKRPQGVVVEFLDVKWNKQKRKLKNLNAVIVQHEFDHLEWVLFVDKLYEGKKK